MDAEPVSQLTDEEWLRIFDEADELGISFILLAGGEPMLRRDIIEAAGKKNIYDYTITTGTGEELKLADYKGKVIMVVNTTFPQMKKADVNGGNELPLYTYLKAQKGFEGFGEHQYKALLEKMFSEADPDWDKKPDIKWNFTKFIIDREGNVAARFESTAAMAEVEACVKALL